MTIHVTKKTLKIFMERYKVSIHQIKWYVDGICEQKNYWAI